MIYLRSEAEIENIRKASKIVAAVLEGIRNFIKPGFTTADLEIKASRLIEKEGAESAFKGYRGYPANICTSVNEAVVHGIPGGYRLKDGDIVSLDVGVKYSGYYGDAALTVGVGNIDSEVERLLKVTEKALYIAVASAVAGNRVGDISNAIQAYVEGNGFSVVRSYVGHGIGTSLHEEPSIPNFGTKGTGPRIKSGMVLAIEAMVNMGAYEVKISKDGWTAVTADGKPSAHFEHTVAITDKGPQILTVTTA